MSKEIKIVLSGAGLLYPLHAGALHYLTDMGYQITHITGVSGGAIIAGAVASGYNPGPELNRMVLEMLPSENKLIDYSWKPWCDWGFVKGDLVEAAMEKLFVPCMCDTLIPTTIGTVNIDAPGNWSPQHMMYNTSSTPNVSLAKAVRASISIPFIFRPVKINGHRHIDGGVASSFPLDIYGTGEDVVGFQIRPMSAPLKPTTLRGYASCVLDIMLDALSQEHIEDAMYARTALLKHDGGSLNFKMTREEAQTLLNEGYAQAKAAFENNLP
jgi:NTE family protein